MSDEREPTRAAGEDEPEGRGRAGLLTQLFRKAIQQGVDAVSEEKLRETVVAEVLRKAIHKGSEVYEGTEDGLRKIIGELPLPKELVDRLTHRLDEYKGEVLRLVRDEVHEFLDHIDIGHELQKVLTSLSLEVSTEIRFIPNEKGVASVKPDIKSTARVKRTRRRRPEGEGDSE